MNYLSTTGLAAYYTTGTLYELPFLLANKTSPATTLTYYGTIVQPPDVLDLHTGSGGVYSALRFTAQVGGTYHLQGYFDGLDNRGYTATDVHVLKNGTINVWGGSHSVNGYGPSSVQAFDLSGVHLSSGDTVDFCVGEGTGGYLSDPTGLAVTITATAFDGSDTPVAVAGYQRTSWTYDAGGRRVGQEVNSGLGGLVSAFTTYAYDAADELLTSATGGAVTSFGYDANGSRTSTALPSGAVTSYAWDAANRLQAVTLPSGGTYTETYRSDGLRHAQTLPSNRGDGVEVSLWDEASGGNLAPLSWKGRVGTAASLLGSDTTTQGTWKNTYGSDGFLIADGGPTLAGSSNLPRYAQVGFGSAGQLQWQASTSDVRGLQKPTALNDRIAAAYYLNPLVLDLNLKDERPHIVSLYLLDWDNLNRSGHLTITDADTNATLYTQTIGGYGNGLWLRFRVSGHVTITLQNTSDTTGMGGSVVSGVFFDPIPDATSANGSVELLAQVFGQGSMGDELLSASGSTRHNIAVGRQYHEDAQGTVEATTLAGTGGVQSAFTVDAWGNQLSASLGTGQDTRSVEDNPFLFLGGLGYWQEPDLGLSYVRARWLDTQNGQWLSVDPVDSEPRYEYAYNSPPLNTDADGQQPPKAKPSKTTNTPAHTPGFGELRMIEARERLNLLKRQTNPLIQPVIDFWEPLRLSRSRPELDNLVDLYGYAVQDSIENDARHYWWLILLAKGIATLCDHVIDGLGIDDDDELGEWFNGFLHGMAKTAAAAVPHDPLNAIIDFIETFFKIFFDLKTEIYNAFVELYNTVVHVMVDDTSPDERGEIAGTLFMGVILLTIAVIDLVHTAVMVGGALIEGTAFGRAIQAGGRLGKTFGAEVYAKVKSGVGRPLTALQKHILNSKAAAIAANIPTSAVEDLPLQAYSRTYYEAEFKTRLRIRSISTSFDKKVRIQLISDWSQRLGISPAELERRIVSSKTKLDWKNGTKVPVSMMSSTGPNDAGFWINPKTGKWYILLNEKTYPKSLGWTRRFRLAHELRHAELFEMLIDYTGNIKQAQLLHDQFRSDPYLKELFEVDAQLAAAQWFRRARPSDPIPSKDFDTEQEYVDRRVKMLRGLANEGLDNNTTVKKALEVYPFLKELMPSPSVQR